MSDADFDLGGSPSVIDTTVSDTRPLEEDNVFKDINDYLDENTSSETIKCTKKCQKLFDDVMKSFHERSGVVKKKDGNLFNSSSNCIICMNIELSDYLILFVYLQRGEGEMEGSVLD